ncbi:hypothetical protein QUB61_39290 [Microcoleus sp. C2D2]
MSYLHSLFDKINARRRSQCSDRVGLNSTLPKRGFGDDRLLNRAR